MAQLISVTTKTKNGNTEVGTVLLNANKIQRLMQSGTDCIVAYLETPDSQQTIWLVDDTYATVLASKTDTDDGRALPFAVVSQDGNTIGSTIVLNVKQIIYVIANPADASQSILVYHNEAGNYITKYIVTGTVASILVSANVNLGTDFYKGVIDCSGNPNYPGSATVPSGAGDWYYVSVAGRIGGASGKQVEIGEKVVSRIQNNGGTEAAVGASWFVQQISNNLKSSGVGYTTFSAAADYTVTIAGTLGVEANSLINQDLTTDATVSFAGITATGTFALTGKSTGETVTVKSADRAGATTGSVYFTSGDETGNADTGLVKIQSGNIIGNGNSGYLSMQSGDLIGDGTTGYIQIYSGSMNGTGNTGNVTLNSGTADVGNSGVAEIYTGGTTTGDTGAINIYTGNATTGTSGLISIDTGTGSVANGVINIGTTNAHTINLGHAGTTTNTNGALTQTVQAATIAYSITADATGVNNAKRGIIISKDITNSTAIGAIANTQDALLIQSSNATSATASGATTVSGYLSSIQQINTTSVAMADVYSGTVFGTSYSASCTAAGTATSTGCSLEVDYNLNGTINVTSFDASKIDYDTTGAVAYANGTYNILNITGTDANTPTCAATTTLNGTTINLSGIKATDADLVLNGLTITMPTEVAGTATVYALNTNGRIITTAAPISLTLPSLGVGVYGTPVVDVAASDNIAFSVNLTTGVNKTNPGDSCMAGYFRSSNTADGANTRLQSLLASTGVAFDCYDAYGLQSNMLISAGAVATGNLTAVSGKVTVSDAVATGIISAGLFTLEGAFNPAALTYGVWIDITTGITADSGLIINNNASTCTNGINLAGTFTSHITSSTTMITDMPVTAPGAGFDTAGGVYVVPFGKRGVGGMIVTEIYVDLGNAAVSSVATLNDIIGEAAGGAAYIGRITAANNGTVVAMEVVCLEAPATGDADIDISAATAADGAYNADVTALAGYAALLTAGASWTDGMVKVATALPAADSYIYLSSGNGGVAGAYSTGKFIIRIYGV